MIQSDPFSAPLRKIISVFMGPWIYVAGALSKFVWRLGRLLYSNQSCVGGILRRASSGTFRDVLRTQKQVFLACHEADNNPCAMGKNYDVRLSQSMSQQQMASELSKLGKLSGAPVQKQVLENGEKVVYLRNPNALDKLKQAFSRNDTLQTQRAPARALIYEKFGLNHLSDRALMGINNMFSRGKGSASEVAAAMTAAAQSRQSADNFYA